MNNSKQLRLDLRNLILEQKYNIRHGVHWLITKFQKFFRVLQGKRYFRGRSVAQWSELGIWMQKTQVQIPRLGLLIGFVLGDPRGKFTTLCK